MLSSITPLGQRGRGASWKKTVVGFWIGAVVGGVVVFSMAGLAGMALGLGALGHWFPIAIVVLAALLDWVGVRPPGPKRQVDEDWLGRYRDWVTGLGYGAQLGSGFATIVPTFGTWAIVLVAAASGIPLAPLLGAGFGLGRSLLLVATRNVGSTSSLAGMMRRFTSAEPAARLVSLVGYGLAILMVGLNVT